MMNTNKNSLRLLLAALALVIACCVLVVAGLQPDDSDQLEVPMEVETTKELEQQQPPPSKPKLFNFVQFKQLFHKSYRTIGEELRRQKLFLASLMQSFISYFRFTQKKLSSFESVNQMSDWTQAEFEATLIPVERYFGEYLGDGVSESEPELAAAGLLQDTGAPAPHAPSWISNILGGLQAVGDKITGAIEDSITGLLLDKGKYRPDLPDEVFVDHRTKSRCFTPIRNQGHCGSCYIFSTIALYEWAYCMQTGARVKLSEQYLLDCGYMSKLNGCGGGNEITVSEFVRQHGFELLDRYRYAAKSEKCPYDDEIKKNDGQRAKMGYLKLDKPKLATLMPNYFDEELKRNPFIIAIYPSHQLQHYGGGIDTGEGCSESRRGLHSVVLVGSGRKDGYEYWIIRNSYSQMWGESGYYRLRRDSKCLAALQMGFKIESTRHNSTHITPTYEFSVNQKYDWKILARKFHHRIPPQLPPPPRQL